MSDLMHLKALTKSTLLEIAKQAHALGIGLQNAAPGDKALTPNKSVQYLLIMSEKIAEAAKKCDEV